MFSQTVEYALRAVVHLAAQSPSPRTTDQIAAATLVPKAYLSKVMQGLCRSDIVQSKRGIGGGVTLVKSPSDLTILEVVNAVEPMGTNSRMPAGTAAHGVRLCPLHKRLDNALATVEAAFRKPRWPNSWPSRPAVRRCVKCHPNSRYDDNRPAFARAEKKYRLFPDLRHFLTFPFRLSATCAGWILQACERSDVKATHWGYFDLLRPCVPEPGSCVHGGRLTFHTRGFPGPVARFPSAAFRMTLLGGRGTGSGRLCRTGQYLGRWGILRLLAPILHPVVTAHGDRDWQRQRVGDEATRKVSCNPARSPSYTWEKGHMAHRLPASTRARARRGPRSRCRRPCRTTGRRRYPNRSRGP